MAENNPQTNIKDGQAIATAAYAATNTPSTGQDSLGFSELLVSINVGTCVGAASGLIRLQESSAVDGSGDAFATWTNSTFTALTTSNHQKCVRGRVKLEGRKRYIRATLTYTGNGTTEVVPAGVTFLFLNPADTAQYTPQTYDVNA